MTVRNVLIGALAAAAVGLAGARAQERLEIFDAHLHYNQEPAPFYALDKVLEVFRRNGITGIVATSRPNKGTHQLVEAKAPGLWVVPFIRPYRVRSDIQTWFNDPAIFDLIKSEYERGYYRGIGEFHIYGKAAASDWVKKMVDFAVERNLYLHAHCDEEALLILFGHNAKARIIWAHTGFSVPPARVAELLDQHKDALWGELSYRNGITERDGKLTAEWRACSSAIPTASCSAPTPGSTSAGSATIPSSRNIAAGWRSFRPSRPAASPTATHCGCSGRGQADRRNNPIRQ